MKPVLDVCCGPRMFWFNKKDSRCLFVDKRRETHITDTRPGRSPTIVNPDEIADFTNLPFPDNKFYHVVFDPPHTVEMSETTWLVKKYGTLKGNWKGMLRDGFAECFRVLKPNGTLVFKWNELHIPVGEILKLTPEKPLYGHRSGKQSRTHWISFIKKDKP